MNSLFQNITHALGWSIVHSLWQGLLIYSVLCLLYISFPKSSSRNRYVLAFCAQLCIFAAFACTFYYYLDFSSTSNPADLALLTQNFAHVESPQAIFSVLESLFPWFSSLYVIGLLAQLILFTNSYSKLHYLRTRGLRDVPTLWLESFQNISTQFGLGKHVRFFLSEKIPVPITLGHLNPIILFPIALVNNLDIKQVESILIHELAHIKRHDYLLNLLKVMVETILFFNPFTWLISKYIETEREHACDDVVIQWVPSPIAYAQALMSVEVNSTAPAYSMAATGKNYHLLHRIQRITKMEKRYTHVKQHLLAVALSTLALITIAWIAPANENTNVEKETAVGTTFSEQNFTATSSDVTCEDTTTVAKLLPAPQNQQDTILSIVKPPQAAAAKSSGSQPSKAADPLEENFNSAQWEASIANAKKIEEYYDSPAWKAQIAKIEENARKVEDYYNSPQWKAQIAKIEENARKVEDYYNSPQWKAQIAKIEENARKVEDYYNSPQWKAQIAKIEENARKVEDYYNSPEFREKITKIEENAKKLTEYYDSSEWKEKVKIFKSEASQKN